MAKDEEYHIHRTANHHQGPGKLKVIQNKTRAYNMVDKLDNEYGGVAHTVKRVPKEHEQTHWANNEGKPNK